MINCSSNTLRICKFISTNNGIVKPDNGDEFHIVVESCSMKRYYSLNRNNCFCVQLEHLCNETYCVYEDSDEDEVTYEVDGETATKACFDFNNQDFHRIRIINHEHCRSGSLHIKKRVFNACGEEISSDDSFRIRIRGVNYDAIRVLNRMNDFQVVLHDLPFGSYEVSERGHVDYDTTYYVNGVEKERGIISVDGDENRIEVFNRINNGNHVLRICKWIRHEGRLVKPDYDQSFDIILRDRHAFREYTLDCSNRFCTTVEGNRHDIYVLNEVDGYNVVYEVDGEEVDKVRVRMDEDHDVRIINIEDEPPCSGGEFATYSTADGELEADTDAALYDDAEVYTNAESYANLAQYDNTESCADQISHSDDDDSTLCNNAVLRIQKWIEEDGRLFHPNMDDVFSFRIQGYSNEAFELSQANNFTMIFDDLNPGYYCIYEDMQTGYDIVYDVNGVIQEDGYVFVDYGTTEVSIINRSNCPDPDPQENIIHLMKRVNACGNSQEVIMPDAGSFEIYVNGPNGVAYYTLSSENNYETFISAENGQYTIYEVNPVNAVTYRLDGVDHIDMVTFNLQDSSHEVMIINHMNRVNYII